MSHDKHTVSAPLVDLKAPSMPVPPARLQDDVVTKLSEEVRDKGFVLTSADKLNCIVTKVNCLPWNSLAHLL